jgi:hypothetical protein
MARFDTVGKLMAQPGRRGELVELLMATTRERPLVGQQRISLPT